MIRLFSVVVAFLAMSSSTVHSYSLFSKSTIGTDEHHDNLNIEAEESRKTQAGTIPKHHHQQQQQQQQIISSGLFHNCAITQRNGMADDSCGGGAKKCGRVKCWGHNDHEQSSPPPGVGLLTDISAGGFFTCGLKVGGEAICWGEIDHPPRSLEKVKESLSRDELANFHHAQRLNKAMTSKKSGRYGRSTVNGGDYYDKISSGMKHACAVTREGEVHCWGRNDYGESTPPSEKKFTQISAGNSFTCGLLRNGAVSCWGKNDVGQSSPPPYIFTQVSASIGGDHACGILLQGGAIRCWGNNGRGQSEPQDGEFIHVSAGTRTSCGVEVKSGTTSIHCWGGRANALLDQVDYQRMEQRRLAMKSSMDLLDDASSVEEESTSHHYEQILLGQDHACAAKKQQVKEDNNSSSSSLSLECWWMTGSDFDAHRVPVGLTMMRA